MSVITVQTLLTLADSPGSPVCVWWRSLWWDGALRPRLRRPGRGGAGGCRWDVGDSPGVKTGHCDWLVFSVTYYTTVCDEQHALWRERLIISSSYCYHWLSLGVLMLNHCSAGHQCCLVFFISFRFFLFVFNSVKFQFQFHCSKMISFSYFVSVSVLCFQY